jgi:hypothetical protein
MPARLFALLLLLAGPVAPTIKINVDKDADFSVYKTWDWVPALDATANPANPANHVRIMRAVERELEARGLQRSMENPDLRVSYLAKIEKKIRGQGYQTDSPWSATPDLRTVVDFRRVEEGTLIVELIDAETKLTVWRGVATQPAPSPDEVGPVIDATVTKLLADFPPKPKQP